MKQPPQTRLQRSAMTGYTLLKAGASQLSHQARQSLRKPEQRALAQQQHEQELGQLLFSCLNRLKGSALKVAQMLAQEANFLPAELRQQLSKSCYQVTPLNRALIHKVFQQEFGKAAEHLFTEFHPQAFAAASLGQVHQASLSDGRQLAVKVQYPGIRSSIHSDLSLLRSMLQGLSLSGKIKAQPAVIEKLVAQAEQTLLEELDYGHEAQQLQEFASKLRLPGIVIPEVYPAYSSSRVLTMQKLEGWHLNQWLAQNPDQASRNHYGQLLFDWFWYQVTVLRYLHADPHQGNFLIMADGRLGILDFGCARRLSPEFYQAMAEHWQLSSQLASQTQKQTASLALLRSYQRLQMLPATMSVADFESQVYPALSALQEWRQQPYLQASFDFRTKTPYPQEIENKHQLASQLCDFFAEMPYFDRAYLGLMSTLTQIGACITTQIDWSEPVPQQQPAAELAR